MLVNELKISSKYEFECNISNEIKDVDCYDEWGCAFVWFGEDIGVEYNFCIDNSTNERINCSAIYRMETNKNTDYMETDYDKFVHYEIDFNNQKWKEELENAMCKALIELHNL